MPAPLPLSSRSGRTTDSPIGYFMRLALEDPSLISLAAGLVDQESLPVAEVAAALAELLRDPAAGRAALQYGTQPYLVQSYLKGAGFNSLYDHSWTGIRILKH